MELRRLTIEGIGPFPGKHTVDFTALGVSGLFLLHGPTGSGKSTLIDSIVFALYGEDLSTRERLHSGHASPATEPSVELTFSTAHGLYRVWASPQFERPKRRGGGTTTQNARVRLYRMTSEEHAEGEPVSTSIQEARREIQRIVGLTRDQFQQIVVLPQGKFAAFLTSKPEDRGRVLQDVFGTGIYQRMQEQLRERAAEHRKALETAATQVAAALEAVRDAVAPLRSPGDAARAAHADGQESDGEQPAGDGTGTRGEAGSDDVDHRSGERPSPAALESPTLSEPDPEADGELSPLEEADHWRRETAAHAARIQEHAAAAQEARHDASAAHDAAHRLRRLLDRRADALERIAALDAAEPAHRTRVAQRDAARRAAEVLVIVEENERALEHRDHAAQALEDAMHAAEPYGDDLASAAERWAERRRVCDAAAQDAATARAARGELDRIDHDLERLDADITALRAERLALPQQLEQARGHLGSCRAAELSLQAAEHAKARAEAIGDADRALGRERQTLAALERELKSATGRAEHAVGSARTATAAWLGSAAGVLARERLRPGEPCPVCGSLAHPSPATVTADVPDWEQVESLRTTESTALHAVVLLTERRAASERRIAELESQLAGHPDPASELADAIAHLGEVRTRAAARPAAETSVQQLESRDGELAERLEALGASVNDLKVRRAEVLTTLGEAELRIRSAQGEHATLASATAAAEKALAVLAAWQDAAHVLATTGSAVAEAGRRLTASLSRHGFATAVAAREAGRDDIAELTAAIAEHENNRAASTAVLREPEIAALTGAEDPRLGEVEAAAAEAQRQADAAAAASGRARGIAEATATAADRVRAAVESHAALDAAAGDIVRMADLACGRGATRMALSSWVLLHRFREVVTAANRRLSTMSNGRYELRNSGEREAGVRAQKLGLALEVLDYHIGTARSPHSLSGGETFYTSLALALGLADVVRDESGGISLGTLFIDEGFGTLDPGTLDNVMLVLGELGSHGRAVGVISHVTEMVSRIAERVAISPLPGGGSTLRVIA